MKKLLFLTSMVILSCGIITTGELAVISTPTGTVTNTPTRTIPNYTETDILAEVLVDDLRVRTCPATDCIMATLAGEEWYLGKGDIIMGYCIIVNDEIWFGFDGGRAFAAVRIQNEVYMSVTCQTG